MKAQENESAGCAHCQKAGLLRWRCESCQRLALPSLFCSMPCVWAHGPAVHHDPRTYQIEQRSASGA
jgi:hypothetical protein